MTNKTQIQAENNSDTAEVNILHTPGGEMPDAEMIEKRKEVFKKRMGEETPENTSDELTDEDQAA